MASASRGLSLKQVFLTGILVLCNKHKLALYFSGNTGMVRSVPKGGTQNENEESESNKKKESQEARKAEADTSQVQGGSYQHRGRHAAVRSCRTPMLTVALFAGQAGKRGMFWAVRRFGERMMAAQILEAASKIGIPPANTG